MAKTKTIIRTYYSKKLGKYVTKTYEYAHKSTRGATLVSKTGKVNKKNVDKLKAEINASKDMNAAEKRATIINLDSLVKQRSKDGKKLTESGFWGTEESNDINRMLSNLGVDAEEAAFELGVSEDDILNEANWNGDIFMGQWAFTFTYTGRVFKRI